MTYAAYKCDLRRIQLFLLRNGPQFLHSIAAQVKVKHEDESTLVLALLAGTHRDCIAVPAVWNATEVNVQFIDYNKYLRNNCCIWWY